MPLRDSLSAGVLLVGVLASLAVDDAAATSLRFFGNGAMAPDLDRVKIRIDDPANSNPGPPADIGAGDFTIEFWLRALAGTNTAGPVSCSNSYSDWTSGNVVFDRDRYNQGRAFGIALRAGRLVFGTSTSSQTVATICGSTDLRDGTWHHVAIQRQFSNGQMRIYVDGRQDASGTMTASADLSYPDNGVPGSFCGGPCTNSDPYIVLAAEKHDAGVDYPSFNGWLDELRISTSILYPGEFTPSTTPFMVVEGQTAALYHFDEGSGTAAADENGNQSPGVLRVGGSPQGPLWSTESPFGASQAAGVIQFGAATYTALETAGSATLSVTRTSGTSGPVTIDYASANGTATAGADYSMVASRLSWSDNDGAAKSLVVPIIDDATFEGAETFTVTLTNATGSATIGARSTATVTIQENDPAPAPGSVALTTNLYSVQENAATAGITVTRANGDDGPASVNYATTAGTASSGADFQAVSGTLTWADQDSTGKTLTIPIVSDTTDENDEDFEIVLSGATGASLGAPNRATVRILDDDAPSASPGALELTASLYTGSESLPAIAFSVRRVNGSSGVATIQYATTAGTAAAGTDYQSTSGTLTWAAGDSVTQTVGVPLVGDTLDENDEELEIVLSNATGAALGATTRATVRILDNDAPPAPAGSLELAAGPVVVDESAATASVIVRRTGGSAGAATVQYATVAGTATAGVDFQAASNTLSWADGDATDRTITIALLADATDEPDEELEVVLNNAAGAALGATTRTTIRITDDDAPPTGGGAGGNAAPSSGGGGSVGWLSLASLWLALRFRRRTSAGAHANRD